MHTIQLNKCLNAVENWMHAEREWYWHFNTLCAGSFLPPFYAIRLDFFFLLVFFRFDLWDMNMNKKVKWFRIQFATSYVQNWPKRLWNKSWLKYVRQFFFYSSEFHWCETINRKQPASNFQKISQKNVFFFVGSFQCRN